MADNAAGHKSRAACGTYLRRQRRKELVRHRGSVLRRIDTVPDQRPKRPRRRCHGPRIPRLRRWHRHSPRLIGLHRRPRRGVRSAPRRPQPQVLALEGRGCCDAGRHRRRARTQPRAFGHCARPRQNGSTSYTPFPVGAQLFPPGLRLRVARASAQAPKAPCGAWATGRKPSGVPPGCSCLI